MNEFCPKLFLYHFSDFDNCFDSCLFLLLQKKRLDVFQTSKYHDYSPFKVVLP